MQLLEVHMWIERGCVVEKDLSRDGRRLYQSFSFFPFLHVLIKHIFISIWLKNNHILFCPPSFHIFPSLVPVRLLEICL
jgi:hypothetical protein